jgi:hypothetical protein
MRKLFFALLAGASFNGASAGTLLSGLSNTAPVIHAEYEGLIHRTQWRSYNYGPPPYSFYDPCFYCGRRGGDYITPEERNMQRRMRRDNWQYQYESQGGWRRWPGRPY